MTDMHEAFKRFIQENDGFAFYRLNKLFWQSVVDASLELTDGNQTKACEMLGINRATFRKYNDSP